MPVSRKKKRLVCDEKGRKERMARFRMRSFLRELRDCELVILTGKGYMKGGKEWTQYQVDTVETLKRLMQFVQEGKFATAESMKFVARHFRLGISEMQKAWKEEFSVEKSASTMRSQVSATSQRLYDLFGGEFSKELLADRPQRVKDILDSLQIGEKMFQDIFIGEVQELCSQGYDDIVYSIEELHNEIAVLRVLTKNHIGGYLLKLDEKKVSYIKAVLDRPLVVNGKTNYEKVELLKAFRQLPESRESQNREARQAINIFSGVFVRQMKTVKQEGYDPANVEKLINFLRIAYTPQGLERYLAAFSREEIKTALKKFKQDSES